MLTELSEWVPISVTEESDGSVNVQVMTSSVVIGNRTAPFEAVSFPGDATGTLQIINSIERSRVLTGDFTTGKLAALIQARDQLVPDILSQLDEVARIVIEEVNDIHSESIGLIAFSSLTSANSVRDSAATLDSMGLDFPAEAGDFVIRVVDGNGVVQNLYTVSFDPSVDSLNDLAARIDAIDGAAGAGAGAISAVVTSDNRLEITSNGGLEFTFQGDTSKVLAALGMNTFFAGNDAGSIAVSDFILDPDDGLARIAASATGAEGDNGSALAIASLENDLIADRDTVTIGDFYRRIVSELGVEAQRNKTLAGNMDAIVLDLKNRQEAVAGVSLDEESVNLIKFQQAYNAAARYITTIDALLDRVINGMGVIT
jgi:flagellar hook-associated protein 1 FlgK